jgi:DNA-binding NarL/FixJ family response regulator
LVPISILLADDHTLVRAGLRALVERLPNVNVVAEAKDGREALRLVKEQKPNLVLMDVAMPGLNGLEATARISREYPDVRVIVLSMYSDEGYVQEAIGAGAANAEQPVAAGQRRFLDDRDRGTSCRHVC